MAVPKAEPVLKKKKLFVMPDAYVLAVHCRFTMRDSVVHRSRGGNLTE